MLRWPASRRVLNCLTPSPTYDSFWLKMMFVAPAVTVASGPRLLRRADETVIAYVEEDYTFLEKLPLEAVANRFGYRVVPLANSEAITSVINDLPVTQEDGCTIRTKLQDVVFFCHGTPGRLALNYDSDKVRVDLTKQLLPHLDPRAFVEDGKLFSFACRTGNGSRSRRFRSDAEARPEHSLAQQLSDHFNITVMAYLTRTYYGEVLRNRADSATISATLRAKRLDQEHSVIDLSAEHEALPHPGLGENLLGLLGLGPRGEGTNGFSLWRKAAARQLPGPGETPAGLSRAMIAFTPRTPSGG